MFTPNPNWVLKLHLERMDIQERFPYNNKLLHEFSYDVGATVQCKHSLF